MALHTEGSGGKILKNDQIVLIMFFTLTISSHKLVKTPKCIRFVTGVCDRGEHPRLLSGDAFSVYSTCASTPISLPFSFSRKGAKYRKEAVFHCFDFVFPLEGGRTLSTSLPANCFREYFFIVSRKGAKYCSCFSECIFVGNIIFPYICEVFEMMSFNLGVPDLNALSF